jgi:hypothetical protein
LDWLVNSGIACHCFNISNLALLLSFSEKRNLYKLYTLDMGLLCAVSMNGIQDALLSGDIRINEGMFAENYVAVAHAKKELHCIIATKRGACLNLGLTKSGCCDSSRVALKKVFRRRAFDTVLKAKT